METVIFSEEGFPETEPKDNHYSAIRLEKLPSSKLARIRKKLYCSDCYEKAAYVSRSTNGRAPHCRSVHRLVNGKVCPQKSPESDMVSTQGYRSVQAIKNDQDVYVVDFNFEEKDGVINAIKPEVDSAKRSKGRGYRKFGEASGQGKSEWSRRLSTLLSTLRSDPQFARSSANIKVFGYTKAIRDTFYNTDNFASYMSKLKPGKFPTFFWGSIWDAGIGSDGGVWLNTGEDEMDLSIKIPEKVFQKLKNKCRLSRDEPHKELNGSWFLIYGWYNKSAKSGKPYLSLLEPFPEFISLLLSD